MQAGPDYKDYGLVKGEFMPSTNIRRTIQQCHIRFKPSTMPYNQFYMFGYELIPLYTQNAVTSQANRLKTKHSLSTSLRFAKSDRYIAVRRSTMRYRRCLDQCQYNHTQTVLSFSASLLSDVALRQQNAKRQKIKDNYHYHYHYLLHWGYVSVIFG